MEPLLSLSTLKDWKKYTPAVKGYTEAPAAELKKANITGLLNCLTDLDEGGILVGKFAYQDAPSPGVVIKNVLLRLPLARSELQSIARHGARVEGSPAVEFDTKKVKFTNPGWDSDAGLTKGAQAALVSMSKKSIPITCKPAGMVIASPSAECSHTLNLSPVSANHFATVLVLLPLKDASTATLDARHGPLAFSDEIYKSSPFSTLFVALYTGMESAVLKVSGGSLCYLTYHIFAAGKGTPIPTLNNLTGPRAEIAKAFAAWHKAPKSAPKKKNGAPTHILYHLDGKYRTGTDINRIKNAKDRLVLSHLAAPARHYGFDILLAHADISQNYDLGTYKRIDSDDDECGPTKEDLRNMDKYDMEVEVEWAFTGLNGRSVEIKDDKLVQKMSKEIEDEQNIYNWHINFHDTEGGEIDGDGDRYEAYFTMSCGKQASFILVVPTTAVRSATAKK